MIIDATNNQSYYIEYNQIRINYWAAMETTTMMESENIDGLLVCDTRIWQHRHSSPDGKS